MKTVYIAHRLGAGLDREQNRERGARWFAWACSCPGVVPLAPWLILSGIWTEERREEGLAIDLQQIEQCDELWLCGDDRISPGMEIERLHAVKHGISVREMVTSDGEPP